MATSLRDISPTGVERRPQSVPGVDPATVAAIQGVKAKGTATLLDDGSVAVVFDEPLAAEPRVVAVPMNVSSVPIVLQLVSLETALGEWTGFTLQAWQLVALPPALTDVADLSDYAVAQASGLAGVAVHWIAV